MTVKEYNKAVDEYADAIFRFIRADLRDDERAHDIVQDSFEKLWRNVVEIDYGCVKAWLFSTAYNSMVDIIRKERRIINVEEYNADELFANEQFTDLNELLHAALEKLPEAQRTAILLRDYEGYSYKEIGEITQQSEAQVKINIYRGRVALKKYIVSLENAI